LVTNVLLPLFLEMTAFIIPQPCKVSEKETVSETLAVSETKKGDWF
jgi:hypothetical protein